MSLPIQLGTNRRAFQEGWPRGRASSAAALQSRTAKAGWKAESLKLSARFWLLYTDEESECSQSCLCIKPVGLYCIQCSSAGRDLLFPMTWSLNFICQKAVNGSQILVWVKYCFTRFCASPFTVGSQLRSRRPVWASFWFWKGKSCSLSPPLSSSQALCFSFSGGKLWSGRTVWTPLWLCTGK